MTKQRQYVAFVLDQSASMEMCKQQAISGFNEFVGGLKQNQENDTRLTLSLFNSPMGVSNIDLAYHGKAVGEVPTLTEQTYRPDGNTPLWDAVGRTIHTVSTDVAAMTEPKPTIVFVILTDGFENASKEFDQAKVRALIEERTAEGTWTFVYLGADQDAWLHARTLGIPQGNTRSYDSRETKQAFGVVARGLGTMQTKSEMSTRSFFDPAAEAPKSVTISQPVGRDPWAKS